MKNATKKTPKNKASNALAAMTGYHPLFGKASRDLSLGIGILMAESGTCAYEIVSAVSTINEAFEMAESDSDRRIRRHARGEEPMHVEIYKVFCQNYDGDYRIIAEIDFPASR